ncbi:MAG: N-acetylmuramoyl-L-alanine amidase [Gammaproteobacteria bacterium]|nr:N-acetylmuramoyl-L-alanine amidase [Gammaproteobacteria bacterium]
MQGKIISKLLFFAFLITGFSSAFADETPLRHFSLEKGEQQLSLKFQFDNEIKYHCLLLEKPDRLVIDFENVLLKTKLSSIDNAFIKSVRCSDHEHEYLRLVFDLKQKIHYMTAYSVPTSELSITLSPGGASATEVTLKSTETHLAALAKNDIIDSLEESVEKPIAENTPTKLSRKLIEHPEPTIELSHLPKSKNIVVVIDPGHGGKDPGAAGPHGTVEKEVVLKISKALQAMLNDEPGFCAVLTRSTDCYIPLRKRLSLARKNHADIFIAIHADAYNHSHASGASVYALSQRGATSEAAKWLAEKENESELEGLSAELADKDAILRSVLIDLSQTHTIESSLHIGNNLLGHLGKFSRLHHPRVEQAAFVVLKSPDIPSVLVETGFLSNPEEEEKLRDPAYQHQTALAIKEGIKQYFLTNSASSSWFAKGRNRK